MAVLAIGFLWPVAGHDVSALLTRDAPGCPHSSDLSHPDHRDRERQAILCLVNAERAAHGLPPLEHDPVLERAAQLHAEDMSRRRYFAHDNPDGVNPDQRIRAAGYRGLATGENLAWGEGATATPAETVQRLMDSPGHRANILRPQFTYMGVGVTHDAPVLGDAHRVGVYVQNFGG